MPTNLMPDQTAEEVSLAPRHFDFKRDSFAFINELVWAYDHDATTGKMIFRQARSETGFCPPVFYPRARGAAIFLPRAL